VTLQAATNPVLVEEEEARSSIGRISALPDLSMLEIPSVQNVNRESGEIDILGAQLNLIDLTVDEEDVR